MATSSSFFSYTDAQGVEVIVEWLADVPEQYRAQVKHIDLSKPAITLRPGSGERAQTPPAALHVPSFVLGAGTALVQTAVSLVSAGTERMVVEFAEKNLLAKAQSRPDLVEQMLDKARREGVLTTLEAALPTGESRDSWFP